MIKISLLHPSYKRSIMAVETFKNWINSASYPQQVEYILGIDERDNTVNDYFTKFNICSEVNTIGLFNILVNKSQKSEETINSIASKISISSELIISVFDDLDPIKNWDEKLLNLLKGIDNFKDPKFIGVNDGLQPYGSIFTMYIANRAYYNLFSYIVYPEYDGAFGDNEITEVSKILGCIINAPQLLFQHKHWTTGKSKFDETYAKNASSDNFERNKKIFLERKKRNFDLK